MPAKKKPVPTPPNPLPCGCAAMGRQDLENAIETGDSLRVGYKGTHVVHCPLHAAAPKLLAACEKVAASWDAYCDDDSVTNVHDWPSFQAALDVMFKAINKTRKAMGAQS